MGEALKFANEASFGYKYVDQEEAAMMIAGLKNCVYISLEGVDVVRGTDETLGFISFVVPPAGDAILLYPFESQSNF